MRILSIETSCDESAVSIVEIREGDEDKRYSILGNSLVSQAELHAAFGGVFPNLAKREHAKNLVPLLLTVLKQSGMHHQTTPVPPHDPAWIRGHFSREPHLATDFAAHIPPLAPPKLDYIAVTTAPGLEPALWVGVNFAKALARLWNLPIIPVHHLEGHIFASLADTEREVIATPAFPALALLVSGGHTELVAMHDWGTYHEIGATRDDAAGEAFDKVARLLGLGYPGGPEISRRAERLRSRGITPKYTLPRPMLRSGDHEMSFSGLKTAVLYLTRKIGTLSDEEKDHIALEFENAAIEVLVSKLIGAADELHPKSIIIGGGVSANRFLRERVEDALERYASDISWYVPAPHLSTDNAIMIAFAASSRAESAHNPTEAMSLRAQGDLKISDLPLPPRSKEAVNT